MSLAIPYRDQSRTPLAFGLSVLLHGLLAGSLLAFFFLNATHKVVPPHTFELVSGPPSADPPGPSSASPGPLLKLPSVTMQSVPQPPAPTPPQPVEQVQPAQVQPTQAAPVAQTPPPKPTPVTQAKPITRGPTPSPAKQPKVMSLAEWQKMQGITSTQAARPATRAVPKVGVSTDGIVDNLNKLSSGGGSTSRSSNATGRAGSGENGTSDDYFARVIQQIRAVFVAPPAIDGLSATFRLVIAADGTVLSARIIQTSPDSRFNAAVTAALARLKNVGPPPDGEQLTQDFKFVPSTP